MQIVLVLKHIQTCVKMNKLKLILTNDEFNNS